MIIYFVRHGEIDSNKKRIFASPDENLNKIGELQAQDVGLFFQDFDVDVIYTSTMTRALQTAKVICKKHPHVNLIRDDNLREINIGSFIQKPWSDFEKAAQNSPDRLLFKPETGESKNEVILRARMFFANLNTSHKQVVIVSHGGWIRAVFHLFFNDYNICDLENGCIIKAEYDGKKLTLLEYPITKHLHSHSNNVQY